MSESHPPFYGEKIDRERATQQIETILQKYRKEPPSPQLHKKIWEELQEAKSRKEILIPFKIEFKTDPSGVFPDCIHIILDTKV